MVETMPLEKAAEAYARMMAGKGPLSSGVDDERVTAQRSSRATESTLTSGGETMNQFQKIFDAPEGLLRTGVTRSYEWRVGQLDRMGRMIKENEAALQEAIARDFKTPAKSTSCETLACFLETEFRRASFADLFEAAPFSE